MICSYIFICCTPHNLMIQLMHSLQNAVSVPLQHAKSLTASYIIFISSLDGPLKGTINSSPESKISSVHAVSLPLSAFLSYPTVSKGLQLQLSVLRPFEPLKTACKWMHASGCLIFQSLYLLCPVVQVSPGYH